MLDWAQTMIGYPAHRRAAAQVIGLSHCNTYDALRLAEQLGWYTGWVASDSEQPQLVGLKPGVPEWMAIAEWFVDDRVPYTEGVISGVSTFIQANNGHGTPPQDRSLLEWAEEKNLPWFQIVDNEYVYWGGLNDVSQAVLLTWFCCQDPITIDWREQQLDQRFFHQLQAGLFSHGWSRNGELASSGGLMSKARCDIWGGVPQKAEIHIDREGIPGFAQVNTGLRCRFKAGVISGQLLNEPCPIREEDGRLLKPLG